VNRRIHYDQWRRENYKIDVGFNRHGHKVTCLQIVVRGKFGNLFSNKLVMKAERMTRWRPRFLLLVMAGNRVIFWLACFCLVPDGKERTCFHALSDAQNGTNQQEGYDL